MTDPELQAEQLSVLPMRLETITVKGGDIHQKAWVDQDNFSNQLGGDCLKASCDQTNVQVNAADVDQHAKSTTTVKDVIEDNRKIFQKFH